MGLIRKSLAASWRGPSCYDPAINTRQSPMYQYAQERDPSVLVPIPGQEWVTWTLRSLKQSEIGWCEEVEEPMRYMRAFLLACVGADGPDTGVLRFEGPRDRPELSRESLDVHIPTETWMELGALALQRGRLTLGESQPFALPRGLPPIPRRGEGMTADAAEPSSPQDSSGA